MTYEDLLIESDKENLIVREKALVNNDGRILGNRIAIRKDIPTLAEKACVLAEELGHYHTSAGNIIDLQDVRNRKQEHRARMWAYDNQIGLLGIVNAFNAGCRNRYEMAEHLDVTEQFLDNSLEAYKSKYGIYTVVDCYVIYFIPNLGVIKLI